MSVNKGGWTLFYKNSNAAPEGESYFDMLADAHGFLSSEEDVADADVVGVSPVEGLNPISLMAIPVNGPLSTNSAIYFDDADIAHSVVEVSDVIEGCNTYSTNFTLVETWLFPCGLTCSGKEDFSFFGFSYNNGTFNFRSCDESAEEEPSSIWFGDVFAKDARRVVSCGGLPGSHCMYFMREGGRGSGV